MFCEIDNNEMMEVEGGIGLIAAVGIGAVILVGGTALGIGAVYAAKEILK